MFTASGVMAPPPGPSDDAATASEDRRPVDSPRPPRERVAPSDPGVVVFPADPPPAADRAAQDAAPDRRATRDDGALEPSAASSATPETDLDPAETTAPEQAVVADGDDRVARLWAVDPVSHEPAPASGAPGPSADGHDAADATEHERSATVHELSSARLLREAADDLLRQLDRGGRLHGPPVADGDADGQGVRVHAQRIDRRPGPIRYTPSEAVTLAEYGPQALRRRKHR